MKMIFNTNFKEMISAQHTSNCVVTSFFSIPVALSVATSVMASDYFDPSFLGISGGQNNVDLSAFSGAGAIAEGEYPLIIYLNQQEVGIHNIQYRKSKTGQVSPQLNTAILGMLGVDVENIPELNKLPKDKTLNELSEYIPKATVMSDISKLRLDISVPQVAMKPKIRRAVDPKLWDDGITAIVANYNFSAGRTDYNGSGASSKTDNIFTQVRGGINIDAWRLRSTMTHTYSESSGYVNQSNKLSTRKTNYSNTYLMRGVNELRSNFLIGESSTSGDVFDSVPFRGVRLSSDEQMLPTQLRGYAPDIIGVANTNARVTVRQNGNIVYETYVAPGQFRFNDIQQAGLSGDFNVTVSESDGSVRTFVVPYSALPIMQRAGSLKYEVAAGRYNGGITTDSRRADFIQGSVIYGFHDGITIYGGGQIGEAYHSWSLGSGFSLGDLGAISTDVTGSHAKFDDQDRNGQSYRLRYSKGLMSTGTSIDLTALRYSTKDYFNFSEFNSQGFNLEEDISPWLLQRRRSSLQTQLSQTLGWMGNLSLRASRDNFWGSDRTINGVSASYSNSWHALSYNISYNIDRIKDSVGNWPENRQVAFNISMPLSLLSDNPQVTQSMYATSSLIHDNSGRVTSQFGINGSALDNSLSYGITQSVGNQGQSSNSNLNVGWQGSKGTLSGGYSYSDQSRTLNVNAGGGLLIHQDGITFSRSIGESAALIEAPGAVGVSVSNGTAITDRDGYAVVPYLTAYGKNNVGLNPTTLPAGVDVKQSDLNVYPTKGAIVKAKFITRVGYQALLTLQHKSGYVPFGSIATLTDSEQNDELSSIVGDNGLVYLSGLPESGHLDVKWGGGREQHCTAYFNLADLDITDRQFMRELRVICQ